MVQDWGDDPLFVDLGHVGDRAEIFGNSHPVHLFFDNGNRRFLPSFVPVTSMGRDPAYQDAVRSTVANDRLGLGLRLKGTELMQPTLSDDIDQILTTVGLSYEDVDLLVDFGIANDAPPNLRDACQRLPCLARWRTFTILSGAFPKDLTGMDIGRNALPRYDWQAWRDQVTAHLSLSRLPSYGDFVIAHAIYTEPKTDRPNPSASIRYAADDHWVVMRGEAIYGEGPGLAQYPAQALLLAQRPEFRGENFSPGDQYIRDMSNELGKNGNGRTGNPRTWLQAGINHHLTLTARQIANLFDS